ncbi:MAG TPA: flagellar basal body L-ring protein FlgH [Planctomycetota bacterium]|nr:flagellar basal body L-ring protein FlgH [Planctomycetota bacterium]
MNARAFLVACALGVAVLPAQNLYRRAAAPRSPIADHRAMAVGDILTILVSESHKVANNDKTERKTDTSLAARLEAYTLSSDTFKTNVLPKFDARSEREMTGESKQQRDSVVQARFAVLVIDVLPNGNLVVAGARQVQVDDEIKTLRISGVVRPLDVSQQNTVASQDVADARISVQGEGASTRTTTKGPVGTLFETMFWALWPF